MVKQLIQGLVYVEFHDIKGINPVMWIPEDLDEHFLMLCGIRATSLVAGEEDYLPKSLIIVPFPSKKLKAMLKFLRWKDKERRGDVGQASLFLVFNETDDAIFYKARPYLEDIFDDIIEKIIAIEVAKQDRSEIKDVLLLFQNQIAHVLQDLKEKELMQKETEFPKTAEAEQGVDIKAKIIICGDPRSGKTSIALRYTDNSFSRTYLPTIGVNVSEKTLKINGKIIQLVLWDLAGQSKFEITRIHFYQGAEVVLLIFDLTNRESFKNIEDWYEDILKNSSSMQKIIYLIGNKLDLKQERTVSRQEAEKMAKKLNITYIETSALTGENINHMFTQISTEIIKE